MSNPITPLLAAATSRFVSAFIWTLFVTGSGLLAAAAVLCHG
jgi:hypothetical protein